MNTFEQVSSDHHQMSLAGASRSDVQGFQVSCLVGGELGPGLEGSPRSDVQGGGPRSDVWG